MILDKYVSIPGLPGIHKIVSSRSNGLFIFDTIENRQRFVPVRGSNFTPLATISMYTETEEGLISLNDVFDRVKTSLETTPLPAADGNSGVFRNWFSTVIPEHDKDRVHIADIKKLVKWYTSMDANGLVAEAEIATAEPYHHLFEPWSGEPLKRTAMDPKLNSSKNEGASIFEVLNPAN